MVNEPEMPAAHDLCALLGYSPFCVCVRDCFGFLPAYPLMFGADQREARHTPKHQPFLGWFFPAHPLMLGADQREARHTPKHQPFLGWFFPAHPLMLGADQREAVVGAGHRGMLRHLANSSCLAFCVRSAASVSLRSLDCRASRSAVIPGFKYSFHFFNDTSFS